MSARSGTREDAETLVFGLRGVSHSARQRLCLSGQRPLRVLPRLRHSRSQERGLSHRPLLLVGYSGGGLHFLEVRSLGIHLLVTSAFTNAFATVEPLAVLLGVESDVELARLDIAVITLLRLSPMGHAMLDSLPGDSPLLSSD